MLRRTDARVVVFFISVPPFLGLVKSVLQEYYTINWGRNKGKIFFP